MIPLPARGGLLAALCLLAPPLLASPAEDCRNRAGLPDEARRPLCTAAIASATDPRDRADLLLWRGAIEGRAGDVAAAQADFAQAKTLAPDWGDPYVEAAHLLADQGETEAALAEIARGRAVEPDSAYALQESLVMLADAGRPEDCLALAPDAMRVAPDDGYTWADRGRCLADSGNPAAALEDYRHAGKLGLDEPFLHANIAAALIDLGRPDEAVGEARAAVAAEPVNAIFQGNLVKALLRSGDADGALAVYDAAIARAEGDLFGLVNSAGWGLYLAGRAAEGIAAVEAAVKDHPDAALLDNAELADTYAHLLAAGGRTRDSVRSYLGAVAKDPAREARYRMRLAQLGFDPEAMGLEAALKACAATGAACRLSD